MGFWGLVCRGKRAGRNKGGGGSPLEGRKGESGDRSGRKRRQRKGSKSFLVHLTAEEKGSGGDLSPRGKEERAAREEDLLAGRTVRESSWMRRKLHRGSYRTRRRGSLKTPDTGRREGGTARGGKYACFSLSSILSPYPG